MNQLRNFMESAAPVADDIAFEWHVMKRIEQRRFRRALLENFLIALAAALAMIGAAPALNILWRESLAPVTSDSTIMGALVVIAYVSRQIMLFQRPRARGEL